MNSRQAQLFAYTLIGCGLLAAWIEFATGLKRGRWTVLVLGLAFYLLSLPFHSEWQRFAELHPVNGDRLKLGAVAWVFAILIGVVAYQSTGKYVFLVISDAGAPLMVLFAMSPIVVFLSFRIAMFFTYLGKHT